MAETHRSQPVDVAASRQQPSYRLVRRPRQAADFEPSPQQQRVIAHDSGRLRVLAGPGTGKTATMVAAVADRIENRGISPDSIMCLTFSKRAANDIAARLTARLDAGVTIPEVRTLHSYAYALLRRSAAETGDPPPRLLDASQADLMVRDLLAGQHDEGRGGWPEHLAPALTVPTFAAELREFLLRTAGRRMSPSYIASLGRTHRRPEWIAAAKFIDEYRNVADLRQASGRFGAALDQAELTTAALEYLERPAALAAAQRSTRRLFVDEYQDVDPAQAHMIELLASGCDELVVIGDPDQSIYTFRGALPGAMDRLEVDETLSLTVSHRLPENLIAATRRVAALIPGRVEHRHLTTASTDGAPGIVETRILRTTGQEAAYIADRFRRAHLEDNVPWSQMAVIVRSPSSSGETLHHSLTAAGIPVSAATTRPLSAHPVVLALLRIISMGAGREAMTPTSVLDLLSSPVGRMDPIRLRRLRRAVRVAVRSATSPSDQSSSSAALLADMVVGRRDIPADLARDLAAPLHLLHDLLEIATDMSDCSEAEDALWALWERSGLVTVLLADIDRGGRPAEHAQRQLDAVSMLFRRAGALADQLPGTGIAGFLEAVGDERLPAVDNAVTEADAVSLVSAHAAKGLEWDIVAVAGVAQDIWPDTRPRASLLSLQELLDADDGLERGLPRIGQLADERRLFYVATTRARSMLLVTAVDNEDMTPSRFISDVAGEEPSATGWPKDARGRARPGISLPEMVADLRKVVTEPTGLRGDQSTAPVANPAETGRRPPEYLRRDAAARALARLAAHHVRGADPASWYGLLPPSTDSPRIAPGAEVIMSPSHVESVTACPLRAVLERQGARGDVSGAQLTGIAVHALAEGLAAGATATDLDEALEQFVTAQDHLSLWEMARLRRSMMQMRSALEHYVADNASDRRFLAAEASADLPLPRSDEQEQYPVRVRGRADWLWLDDHGRVVVTDFKTGSAIPSKAQAAENAQLALYQLLVALGAFDDLSYNDEDDKRRSVVGPGRGPGGAELVYLRGDKPTVRRQLPQTPEARATWISRARNAAEESAGAMLTARTGPQCERCPVRASCPIQPEGRQVGAP